MKIVITEADPVGMMLNIRAVIDVCKGFGIEKEHIKERKVDPQTIELTVDDTIWTEKANETAKRYARDLRKRGREDS